MKKTIRVVVKKPFKKAVVQEIENDLKTLQGLVEGLIDCVTMPTIEGVDMIVNDEGLYMCVPNILVPEYRSALFGTLVIAGYNDEGDHISLTNEQIDQVMAYLDKNSLKSVKDLMNLFNSDAQADCEQGK